MPDSASRIRSLLDELGTGERSFRSYGGRTQLIAPAGPPSMSNKGGAFRDDISAKARRNQILSKPQPRIGLGKDGNVDVIQPRERKDQET